MSDTPSSSTLSIKSAQGSRFATRPRTKNTFLVERASHGSEAKVRSGSEPKKRYGAVHSRRNGDARYNIRELNPRVKRDLKNLGISEGLGALTFLILKKAVDQHNPPTLLRDWVNEVLQEFERENVVTVTPCSVRYQELLPGKSGGGPALLALFRFLLSQGKTLMQDDDEVSRLRRQSRFEVCMSSLCYQIQRIFDQLEEQCFPKHAQSEPVAKRSCCDMEDVVMDQPVKRQRSHEATMTQSFAGVPGTSSASSMPVSVPLQRADSAVMDVDFAKTSTAA